MDFGKGELVPFSQLTDELLEVTARDVEVLGSGAEVENAREILKRGTSADRQLDVYKASLDAGADEPQALRDVVDWLIEETKVGL